MKNGRDTAAAQPELGDAFGRLLLDAYKAGPGRTLYEVTERDDGYPGIRDASHYFTPPTPTGPEAELLAQVHGRVFDVGCAAGRHLTYLRGQGVTAVGIEKSAGAVQVCRLQRLDVVHSDILAAQHVDVFDTALLLGGNLALLSSPANATRLLLELARLAAPGAQILATGTDPRAAAGHRDYQDRNTANGRPLGQMRMRVRYQNLATDWIDLWFLPVAELADALAGSPWRIEDVWAGDSGSYSVRLRHQTATASADTHHESTRS